MRLMLGNSIGCVSGRQKNSQDGKTKTKEKIEIQENGDCMVTLKWTNAVENNNNNDLQDWKEEMESWNV